MDQFLYLSIIALLAAFAAAVFFIFRLKTRSKQKLPPDFCMGAIRVTDRQGRDMLIIRKDDGSFEMHEEKKVRQQCVI